jgi:palmitoyltransferase ZDHHC9/14/18
MASNNSTLADPATSALESLSPRSSPSASLSQSTPPTSLGDVHSEIDASKEDRESDTIRRRSGRPRHSVPTYNDNILSATSAQTRRALLKIYDNEAETSNRRVSGATLVDDSAELPKNPRLMKELRIDANWSPADEKTAQYLKGPADGDESEDERPVVYSVWSMGKLVTESVKTAKDKILERRDSKRARKDEIAKSDTFRLFPNLRLPESSSKQEESSSKKEEPKKEEPKAAEKPAKAAKSKVMQEPKAATPAPKPKGRKKFLTQGLYVGQHRNFDPKLSEASNRKRLQELDIPEENRALPLPMFLGEEMLKQDEDYKLPYEVLNPLPFEEHPKDWSKLSRSKVDLPFNLVLTNIIRSLYW